MDPESLRAALSGVHAAYYLVHSLGTRRNFEQEDRQAAANFAEAARQAGVQRIIYLGGLGDAEPGLSSHLRSRQETGDVLRGSGIQVIELRASIIIGSGSLSFELIRSLTERLPVMICPRWVATPTQPIGIEDVLEYLRAVLDLPEEKSRIFEIGGPDVVSYGDIMREYARQRGLRRLLISVPLLTPYLSSLWLGLVTPVYARVGRKLVEGLRNPTVVRDMSARDAFSIRPCSLAEAIRRAAVNEDHDFAETRWSDALSSAGRPRSWGGTRFGTRIVDSRTAEVGVPPDAAFAAIQRIGGAAGWYYGNWLWKLRGWLDLLVGGVGLRRGRRDPVNLQVGDAVDFWRVETIEPGAGYGWLPKCACRGGPGWSSRSRPRARVPRSVRRPSSIPWASGDWHTGTRSTPCTGWSSPACCGAWRVLPKNERIRIAGDAGCWRSLPGPSANAKPEASSPLLLPKSWQIAASVAHGFVDGLNRKENPVDTTTRASRF